MGFMALIMELSPQINSVQWHWKPQSQQREDLEVGADPAKLSLVTRKVWAGSGRQNEEMNGFSSSLSSPHQTFNSGDQPASITTGGWGSWICISIG